MMMEKYRPLFVIPFLLIGGCSSEEDKSTPSTSKKEHAFKDQVQTLEKAKNVEQVLQNKDEKRRQAIEKQTK